MSESTRQDEAKEQAAREAEHASQSEAEEAASPAEDGSEEAEAEEASSGTTDRRSSGTWLALLALVVGLAAGGAAAWLYTEMAELEERLAAAEQARAEAVAALEEDIAARARASERSLRELRSALDETEARVERRLDDQDTAITHARELAGRDQLGWRLAEIRYLLHLGARRLMLAGDVDSAAEAFTAADRALAEIGDPRLLPLRESIFDDIERFRTAPSVDVEGVVLRLHHLQRSVHLLPATAARVTDVEPPALTADDLLERTMEWLRSLVTVRHRAADDVTALPEARDALPPRDALALALDRARTAALTQHQDDYDAALSTAVRIFDEHFDTGSRIGVEFRDALETLHDLPVRATLPAPERTLDLAAELLPRVATRRADEREDD